MRDVIHKEIKIMDYYSSVSIKDFFNILFFLVMSAIAVLSYIQAKKTLFAPIKTEIFKLQIKAFQEVLAFFNKHTIVDFYEEFGFQEILEINSLEMRHAYINTFFRDKIEIPDELIERLKKASYGAIISEEFLEKIKPGSELIEASKPKGKNLDPALKLAKWGEFKLGAVGYTRKYHEKSEELSKLAASPLFPSELTDFLYEFIKIIHQNLVYIGEAVTDAAKEMPKKYTTPDAVIKFRPDWIWNIFNDKSRNTDKVTEKILEYVRGYLKINELMK